MKNAMKKLMSLLMVVALLVSIVPFQASAAGNTQGFSSIIIWDGTSRLVDAKAWQEADGGPDTKTPNDMLVHFLGESWSSLYDFESAYATYDSSMTFGQGETIKAGFCADVTIVVAPRVRYTLTVEVRDRNNFNNVVATKNYTVESTIDVGTVFGVVPSGYENATLGLGSNMTQSGTTITLTGNATCKVYVDKVGDLDNSEDDDKKDEETKDEGTNETATIVLTIKNGDTDAQITQKSITLKKTASYSVENLMEDYWRSDWENNYDFGKAVSVELGRINRSTKVKAPDTITVTLYEEDSNSISDDDDDDRGNADDDEYVFDKTDTNNKLDDHVIRLYIYKNTYFGSADRVLDITDGIAADGQVSLYGDVLNKVKEYYSAKTSDGLQLDGLYFKQGNWVSDWANDAYKYEKIDNLDEAVQEYDVNIIVVVNNAKDKTTYASSDNPKTGDEIFMAVTIMGLSATALACVYFFNKKRAVK